MLNFRCFYHIIKMELHQDILVNLAPIFFSFVFTIVILLTVFHKLKIRWPIRANCWFCNHNASIWRHEADWWLCPSCRQYNGFLKDGGYKHVIPEQRKITQSPKFYTLHQTSNLSDYENGLCIQCNENEEHKLLELRKFERQSLKRTDEEVEEFFRTIEEKYSLCCKCKQVVNNVLYQQSLWLARYKMLIFKQRPIGAIINSGYKIENICRILLTILNSIIIYDSAFWPISIVGVILQMRICFISSANKKKHDILLTILWICISILSPFDEFKLFKINFQSTWISLRYITKYHVVIIFELIIGFINVKWKSYKTTRKNCMAFKRLDTATNSTSLSSLPSVVSSLNSSSTLSSNGKKSSEKLLNFPVNVTSMSVNSGSSEADIPIRSSQILQHDEFNLNQYCIANNLQNKNSQIGNFTTKTSNQLERWSLDDNLYNLSSLSLSEIDSENLVKTSKVFETKVYNISTSPLFSKSNKLKKKSILAPPKLKSVTQTSWVAGGYWQASIEPPPPLSRSSSQSSGFGSAGSNPRLSRERSVHNDFDQCSIISDTTQCCCSPRMDNPISYNSECCINSMFASPTNPACSEISNLTQISYNNNVPLMHLHTNNSSVANQYSQHSKGLITHFQQLPAYRGHTTVITTPVWLPAILCCSLVFNMIVLCTILLI